MKKQVFFSSMIFCLTINLVQAQNNQIKMPNANEFDEAAVITSAKQKGIKSSELKGYVNALRLKFSSEQQLKKQHHIHTPYEGGVTGVDETVIYLSPYKTTGAGCPNMGFENYNFTGWTGGTGNVSTGISTPIYASSGTSIVNPAGMNVNEKNLSNFHTLLTIPPTNPNGPNYFAAGYDTNATKLTGSNHVSQIPLVSPYSFDGVSTRMLGQHANNMACKIKYITTTSTTNKQLTFSYALVLNDPSAHTAGESPYFKVEVRNESTGATIPGCTSYTFNPKTAQPSDSLFLSSHSVASSPVKYRKWQLYSVDLSSLPLGTNVSLNFEVGGCSQGAHIGYAYVDAECGGLGTPYANLCGSNYATLVAPAGYNSYQWLDLPSGNPIPGATNDTLIIPSPTTNTLYAVQMVSPGGCTLTLNDTIKNTTVQIININSSASCSGGNSGSANVQATGSNGVYTYTWTNNSGSVVGSAATATNLAAGNYTVTVASTSCGFAKAVVNVPVAPPYYLTQTKSFCGNSTYIAVPNGSNYIWYAGSGTTATIIPAPNGTNDTLRILPAMNGDSYTLVYTTSSGCKDSVKYTLSLIAGGNTYVSNPQNVCPGNSNGSATVNLNTPFASPYIYTISGPTGVLVNAVSTTATFVAVSGLSASTYSYLIDDGVCLYNSTFTITTIPTNYTVTPTSSVSCFPDPTVLNFNFGNTTPTSCGISSSAPCFSSTLVGVGNGTTGNSSSGYPAPYGNYYKNQREQYLFTASELIAAGLIPGKISSISFQVNSIMPVNTTSMSNLSTYIGTLPNYSIKLKCSSATSLSDFDNSGLNQVFFGNVTPTVGLNTQSFSNAYEWDGSTSLIVDLCYTRNNALSNEYWTSNPVTPQTNTGVNKTVYFRSDATPACGITNGTSSLTRPNIKFGNCPASLPASNYTITVSSNATVTTNFNNDSLVIAPTFTAPPTNGLPVIYTVTVTNPIGSCVKTQTVAVLYPTPITTVTAIANPTVVCEGSTAGLFANGGAYYQWFYGFAAQSNSISTSQTITVTPPQVGNNVYYVRAYSKCIGNIADTTAVIVKVIPKATLVIAPLKDVTKCLFQPYVITTGAGSATSGNTATPLTYNWTTLPGNTPAPGVNTASSYTVNSNNTVTLVVTVNGNCANPTSDTIVITDFVKNLATSIVNTTTVCANEELTLNSLTTGGRPGYNYAWSILPGNSVISTQANLTTISPGSEGTYTVALFVSDSCQYNLSTYQVFTVLPPCNVTIPNVLSPNNDGLNDVFTIKNIEHHPNSIVTILDRWGRKVYENKNYNNEWKAEGTSDGTYFYVIEVTNDKTYNGFISIFHGK